MDVDPLPAPVEDLLRAEALELRMQELHSEANALALRPTVESLDRMRAIADESRVVATAARDLRREQIEREIRAGDRAVERARRPSWKFWRRG